MNHREDCLGEDTKPIMNKNQRKATIALALAAGLTYSSVMPSVTYAEPSLSKINKETSTQQSLKAELTEQQKALKSDLKEVTKKQLKLTQEVSDSQGEINRTNDKIASLKSEIGTLQKRIEKRKGLLKDRLVSIYKEGGSVNYLEVLLGSKDFGDFLDRTKALFTITSQDQKIITAQKNDQQAVKSKKTSMEQKQNANVAKLAKLRSALAEVESLQQQKKIASDALNGKQSDVAKRLTQLSDAAESMKHAQKQKNVTQVSYKPSASSIAGLSVSAATKAAPAVKKSVQKSSSSSSPATRSKAPTKSSFNVSASAATGGISGITGYGNRYIGRSKYVFGASDPASGRFDCSGFVHAAFAANGIGVGRSTGALVSQGRAVSYSAARPGDLVFFDTYKTNGHVGIYLGGGRFIGSQSSTGVAVANMNSGYWKQHFRGVVRRILD